MTTASTLTATETPVGITGRRLHVTLWVLQIALALFFVAIGLPKLAGQKEFVDAYNKVGVGQWLRYVAGTCEVSGAIGLLIPRLRGLAAIGLIGLMIGATSSTRPGYRHRLRASQGTDHLAATRRPLAPSVSPVPRRSCNEFAYCQLAGQDQGMDLHRTIAERVGAQPAQRNDVLAVLLAGRYAGASMWPPRTSTCWS